MQRINHYKRFQLFAIIVLPFALFWNLGITAVHADEATRGLVSLEMIFSKNYLCPTINGMYYYNKPPLYNWILAGFIHLFGFSEFTLRLPTVLSLLGFASTVYLFVKRHLNEKHAFYAAMGLICCVRILFYDSFHGLIDVSFSWFTFLSFVCLYQAFEKQKYWALYLGTYFFMTLCFLMKGLPSLVFQAFSLLAYFLYQKKGRKLFHIAHFVSIALFALIVGTYYFFYFQQNNDFYTYFSTLFSESSKRTVFLERENLGRFIQNRFWNSVIYFLSFPFFLISIMLPWGLLAYSLIRKDFFRVIRSHPLLVFSVLLFMVNISVYWLSPATQARYLFMLFPFALLILLHFYELSRFKSLVDKMITWLLYVLPIFCFAPLFVPKLDFIDRLDLWLMSSVFSALSLLLVYMQHKSHYQYPMMAVIIFFLCARCFFNLTALPERLHVNYESVVTRIQAQKLGELTKGKKVYRIGTTIGKSPNYLNHDVSMYASWERQGIIFMKAKADNSNDLYILTSQQLRDNSFEILYEFETRFLREKKHGENKRFLARLK